VAGSAGEVGGKEEGLTGARFVAGDGGVRRPAVASGTRHWSSYSGGGEALVVASTARGGGVVSCGDARTLGRWW
jgi:hypothetical protein